MTTDQWISVKDRLPEVADSVLCFAPDGKNQEKNIIRQATYVGFGRFRYGSYSNELDGVTHWMPLPEPPKEEL